jgi:hypothetical protein
MSTEIRRALEKALEEARKERDEAVRLGKQFHADARKHFDQSCHNLQRAEAAEHELASLKPVVPVLHVLHEDGGACTCGCPSVARLKPSGQDAEDVETLEQAVAAYPERFREDVRAALSRLAAKARGYEAAVADTAAWRDVAARLHRAAPAARSGVDDDATIAQWDDAKANYYALRAQPHPGAALLEEHRKALVRARNDGLEMAAALVESSCDMDENCSCDEHLHAGEIRAMKDPSHE